MIYRKRIIDKVLSEHMEAFGATLIISPKGCGKTTTAAQVCKTKIEFQDEEEREQLLQIANTSSIKLLENSKPILFDEWQDAPKLIKNRNNSIFYILYAAKNHLISFNFLS